MNAHFEHVPYAVHPMQCAGTIKDCIQSSIVLAPCLRPHHQSSAHAQNLDIVHGLSCPNTAFAANVLNMLHLFWTMLMLKAGLWCVCQSFAVHCCTAQSLVVSEQV